MEQEVIDTVGLYTNKASSMNIGAGDDTINYSDQKIAKAYHELLSALSVDKPNMGDSTRVRFKGQGYNHDHFTIEKKHAPAMVKMFHEINRAITDAYKNGLEEGKRALINLNKGTLTLDDFNKI